MDEWILNKIEEKKSLLQYMQKTDYFQKILEVGKYLSETLKQGHKIILAGNGGSAADAQHFAGEIVGRFMKEREPFPAISLCVDPSVVTSISNDYGYSEVFARQVQGFAKSGDSFVGISTSGNSTNIIRAIEEAQKRNVLTIGLLGNDGGLISDMCDISLIVPSNCTPRIQEMHTFTIHLLCEYIEIEVGYGL